MRIARWLGVGLWIGSWYLMYLEITRWRHVKPSLAFNSDPDPVTGVRPRPGEPLKLLYVVSATAPLAVVASLLRGRRTGRAAAEPNRPLAP
jgi:hypothetical protein